MIYSKFKKARGKIKYYVIAKGCHHSKCRKYIIYVFRIPLSSLISQLFPEVHSQLKTSLGFYILGKESNSIKS